MDMSCEVGKPLPAYYRTRSEPVMAIFDCGDPYKIATPSRGGVRSEPVLAAKGGDTSVECFLVGPEVDPA